jgi:hypothetical protein
MAYTTNVGKLIYHLGTPKDMTPTMQKSGNYESTCIGCNAVYVGQTRRNIHTRYKEHMAHAKKHSGRSSVTSHLDEKQPEHVIPMNSLLLLKEVRQRGKLDANEGLVIDKSKKNVLR